MKKIFSTLIPVAAVLLFAASACSKSSTVPPPAVFFMGGDEVGRPGIATVFVAKADKDNFNGTIPSVMSGLYQAKFQAQLMALNPNYTTNALGLTAAQFTGVLAVDVLNVSASGATSYGTLTGRGLSDDVIHTSLDLIFGGPDGTANPTLNDDHVPANDKAFLSTFPYLASPW